MSETHKHLKIRYNPETPTAADMFRKRYSHLAAFLLDSLLLELRAGQTRTREGERKNGITGKQRQEEKRIEERLRITLSSSTHDYRGEGEGDNQEKGRFDWSALYQG